MNDFKRQDPEFHDPSKPRDPNATASHCPNRNPRIMVEISWPFGGPTLRAPLEIDERMGAALNRLPRDREIDPSANDRAMRQVEQRRTILRSMSNGLADRLLTLIESNDTVRGYEPTDPAPEQTLGLPNLGDALAALIMSDANLHGIIDQYPNGRSILSALYMRVGGQFPRHPEALQQVASILF